MLVLSEANAQHSLKVRNTVSFGLQIAKLIQHKTCLIQRLHPGFHRTLTLFVAKSGTRLSLRVVTETTRPALRAVARPRPYWPLGHSRYTLPVRANCTGTARYCLLSRIIWTVGSLSQLLRRHVAMVLPQFSCKTCAAVLSN